MKIKRLLILQLLVFLALPAISFGKMGMMGTKSNDVDINFFGQLRTFPTFIKSGDFNSKASAHDKIGEENGDMSDHNVRNEARIGWSGKGDNWDFLVILEADFTLNKNYVDRTVNNKNTQEQNFGIERLSLSYDFGPMKLETGWNVKFIDINTGGIVHGDDHPYLGLSGKLSPDFSWEALYIIIQDNNDLEDNKVNADLLDWRLYTLKGNYKKGGFNLSPFYMFSDNEENTNDAKVNYLGFEAYGSMKLGKDFTVIPRFELAYAFGNTDNLPPNGEYDISAMACFASLELNFDPFFNPYFGFTYMQGDDNGNDRDINAFNSGTNISRYSPTFGIENALIYKKIPALGTTLYSNNFAYLPKVMNTNEENKIDPTPGYGGVGNSSSGDSPGVLTFGAGFKGKSGDNVYKIQFQYFMYENVGAIEDFYFKENGKKQEISKDVGTEFDVSVTHNFSNHFKIGNVFSVFFPGEAIEDLWGKDYDDAALINTLELVWTW